MVGSLETADALRPRADRFGEVRIFYQITWVSWLVSAVFLSCLSGLSIRGRHDNDRVLVSEVRPVVAAVVTLGSILALAAVLARRQRKRTAARLSAAQRCMSVRLTQRLDGHADEMSKWIEGRRVQLVVLRGPTSLAWTERSGEAQNERAAVVLTTTLWECAEPDELRVVLAHEAGHIAAGDVESFKRIAASELALCVVGLLVFARVVIRILIGDKLDLIPSITFIAVMFAVVSIGTVLCWSALVMAREVQADAFAADALGDAGKIAKFLEARRATRARLPRFGYRRLSRFLLQPDLGWRAGIPALRNELGSRIEIQLGAGLAGALMIAWWNAEAITFLSPLEGMEALFFWPFAIWIAVVAYGFAWWRSRASQTARAPMRQMARSWAGFCCCLPCVGLLAGASQVVAGRTLTGDTVTVYSYALGAIVAEGFVLLPIALVGSAGMIGRALDRGQGRASPTVFNAVLAFGAAAVTGIFGAVVTLLLGANQGGAAPAWFLVATLGFAVSSAAIGGMSQHWGKQMGATR